MKNKYLTELSRRLSEGGIQSTIREDRRLDIFLHDRPVLYVSPSNDVFLLPAGSQNEEASELYHQVAVTADEVYEYVEAMENAPPLRVSGLHEDFRLLADFGGTVLAGLERENGQGYQFANPRSSLHRLTIQDFPAHSPPIYTTLTPKINHMEP